MSGRERLADQQAQLLRALLADGPPPPGFTKDVLRVEADALRAKRIRVIAMLRPDIADALGEQFTPLAREYAVAHPRTVDTRARHDADAFGSWLIARGELAKPRRRWWRRSDQA